MPRKITVTLVETFVHNGETYSRYRREDTGSVTDLKIFARGGVPVRFERGPNAEAERRLRAGKLWRHRHLVRPLEES